MLQPSEREIALADRIVAAVLRDLNGRSGFDWWWGDIDPGIKNEIREDLARLVLEHLRT